MNYTADDIAKLGTILGVWAHPDDESWCMGGVMAIAAANGQRVVCITATRGDAGQTADENKWPQSELKSIREKELERAMEILGVSEHIWLDYEDGKLAEADSQEAAKKIAEAISSIKPDTIFSFGPDGITGHDDHRTVHHWTRLALEFSGSEAMYLCAVELKEKYESIGRRSDQKFNIYFNTDKPFTVSKDEADLYVDLTPEILTKKVASLQAQASQTAGMFADPDGLDFIQQSCACEAFMKVENT